MYNIMYIISCAIISFVHAVSFTPTVYGRTMENPAYANHPSCSYLSKDGTQFDAFQHPEVSSSYCCFCGLGTMVVGPCDVGDPRSTKCQECSEDEYIDFEPHFERKCFRKSWQICPPPKLYSKGTNKESHRCVCPSGTVENGDDCLEAVVPPLLSVKMDASFTTSPTTAGNVDDTSTNPSPMETIPTTAVTSTVSSETTTGIGDDEPSSPITTQYKPTISERITKHPGTHNSFGRSSSKGDSYRRGFIVTMIILLLLVGIAVVIVVRFISFRDNVTKPSNSTDKSATSPFSGTEPPYVESANGTSAYPSQADMLDEISMNTDTSFAERGNTDPDQNVGNQLLSNPGAQHTVSADHDHISETVPPANESPMSISVQATAERGTEQSTLNSRGMHVPIQREERDPTEQPSELQHQNDIANFGRARENASKIPEDNFAEFAKKLAMRIGEFCREDVIRRIFRAVLDCNRESDLEGIIRNYDGGYERMYQCMLTMIRYKGKELSPALLLEKISGLGYRQYTEAVVSYMDEYVKQLEGE